MSTLALVAAVSAQADFGGWLSDSLQWGDVTWQRIVDSINSAKPQLEPIIWVVGSVLALIPGTFAIYKWLYYRNSRLPERFEEMLIQEEHRLKSARTLLSASVERPESIKSFDSPIFIEPHLGRAMRTLKWASWWPTDPLKAADENLQASLLQIEDRLRSWDDHRSLQLEQQAAALLLRGSIAAAVAKKELKLSADALNKNREALGYFLAALTINKSDHESLEYAAHQHRVLGDTDDAIRLYHRLAKLAEKPGVEFAVVRARALRYQGEMYERKFDVSGVALNLAKAKECLEEALEVLPQVAKGELLEGFIRRWLGSVEDKRNTQGLWRTQFEEAERIFTALGKRKSDSKQAKAGLAEVGRLKEAATAKRQANFPVGAIQFSETDTKPVQQRTH